MTPPPRRSSVAAGAARASGERARRRGTPLLESHSSETLAPNTPTPNTPTPTTPAPARLRVVAPKVDADPDPTPRRAPRAAVRHTDSGDAPEAAASEAVAAELAAIPELAGIPELARAVEFLRRRLTGDYVVDNYGHDPHFTEHVLHPLLRVLANSWFRVEVRGIEHIPDTGGALVVANHAGTVALDSLITTLTIHDHHPAHRALRELGADLVFGTPVLGNLARKGGATLATNADAERLLADGELVGVWPEGFKGVGKPYRERYKLQRFGRGGFVAAAVRTGAPIIPCSVVGSEEIYPMLADLRPLARLLGLPYFPLTPLFPHFGLLGLIPLPSKWIIEFGAPIPTAQLGPAAADDSMLVLDLTERVRENIQQALYAARASRRSVFR